MALIDTHETLPDGRRIRLRLPHASDRDAIEVLLHRLGVVPDEVELARALRFDPRRQAVACATTWIGGQDTLVGFGSIELGAEDPATLVGDELTAPGVSRLLYDALRERSVRRRAA